MILEKLLISKNRIFCPVDGQLKHLSDCLLKVPSGKIKLSKWMLESSAVGDWSYSSFTEVRAFVTLERAQLISLNWL